MDLLRNPKVQILIAVVILAIAAMVTGQTEFGKQVMELIKQWLNMITQNVSTRSSTVLTVMSFTATPVPRNGANSRELMIHSSHQGSAREMIKLLQSLVQEMFLGQRHEGFRCMNMAWYHRPRTWRKRFRTALLWLVIIGLISLMVYMSVEFQRCHTLK